jgi:formylglycine-generating enzyme required for sulfatase activity
MQAVRKLNVFSALVVLVGAVCSATKAGSEEQVRSARQTFRDCANCPEMVMIPAGRFLMGSSEKDIARDVADTTPFNEAGYAKERMKFEQPQHPVEIAKPFALGRYLVTQEEFAAFLDETGYSVERGCTFWINHKYPVDPEATWKRPGFRQTDRDPVVCVSWRDAKPTSAG